MTTLHFTDTITSAKCENAYLSKITNKAYHMLGPMGAYEITKQKLYRLIVHCIHVLPVMIRRKGHRHEDDNSAHHYQYFLHLLHSLTP